LVEAPATAVINDPNPSDVLTMFSSLNQFEVTEEREPFGGTPVDEVNSFLTSLKAIGMLLVSESMDIASPIERQMQPYRAYRALKQGIRSLHFGDMISCVAILHQANDYIGPSFRLEGGRELTPRRSSNQVMAMYFYSHGGTPTNMLYRRPCSVLSKDFGVRHFQSELELHSSDDSIPGRKHSGRRAAPFPGGILPSVMNLSEPIPLCRCLSAVPISEP
jgi:hypothetical protein